ncbi:AzlD domain-containing protein [Celeribacter sp.]|uniref:AzlD domain-containing protein n=1 Tax=Celeribacter sp. TaxID=1890673 RepID=UPI003A90C488
MDISPTQIWIIIGVLGVCTYLIRLSFMGLIGDRPLPEWLLRMLRYTPVAVLPAVVAPMLIGSGAHSGDPLRIGAALATLVVGLTTRNVLWAIATGFGILFGVGALLG